MFWSHSGVQVPECHLYHHKEFSGSASPETNTLRVDTCVWITKDTCVWITKKISRFSILRPNAGRNVSIDCHWENESSNWHVNVPNVTKVLNQHLEKFSENLSHCLSTCRTDRRAQLSAGSHQGEPHCWWEGCGNSSKSPISGGMARLNSPNQALRRHYPH